MIVDLLVVVGPPEVIAGLRLGKSAVEEALAVGRPLGRRELDPLQVVVQVLARGDVPDLPLVPVRAGRGDAVGQQLAVLADLGAGQGDRAVLRERIGVEKRPARGLSDSRRRRARSGSAGPCCTCRSSARLRLGRRELLVIPERCQARADRLALGDRFQEAERDLVLGLDPGAGRGASGSSSGRYGSATRMPW